MKRSNVLSKKEQKTLLELARTSIAAKFSGKELPQFKSPFQRLEETRGVFVTLKKDDKLCGCIGFVMGVKPLYQTVREVAVASAFQDPRFCPLKEDELILLIVSHAFGSLRPSAPSFPPVFTQ